jgi:tight adherence protein B
MMELLDARGLATGCVLAAALLLVVALRRTLFAYERSFLREVAHGLKHNFIVADARALFWWNALLTLAGSAAGWWLFGAVGALIAALSCVLAPRLIVKYLARVRAKKFVYQLPDALLALASALRAGSNLSKGLELLSTRQPAPLGQEFTIVLSEYRIGRPLAESLADLRRRIDTPELDLLNTAINISRRVGGNLADTLESLARTLQEKAHIEGKIEALTAMGRAQGWVVGLLPIFIGAVLYAQQPERMRLLFTEWYGWAVLAVIALMMSVAAAMIRKIVKIDV